MEKETKKKILYITNIEVPYRVKFFNELTKHCHLTVAYEHRGHEERNCCWARSEEKHFRAVYGGKSLFSLLRQQYDTIILGCYQTPFQILTGTVLRLLRIPYVINLDGEAFAGGKGWKNLCKRFLLSGAAAFLTAGKMSARSLGAVVGQKEISPYFFSSLSEQELKQHRQQAQAAKRTDTILVVGQYFPYKGLDAALEAARMDTSLHYRFVGTGSRTAQFLKENAIPPNVEVIPFLQKQELEREYTRCALLVLPSRRECWGLVINEAASFGTPVVSTWGSGAAVEFLAEDYPQYLARPGDPPDLLRCIQACLTAGDQAAYSRYLLSKTAAYSIESSVQAHLRLGGKKNGICDRAHF